MLHVISAEYINGFKYHITFDDGTSGTIDLEHALIGPIFEQLKDPAYFREGKLDHELETLVWPNGADFAPEFLRSLCDKEPT